MAPWFTLDSLSLSAGMSRSDSLGPCCCGEGGSALVEGKQQQNIEESMSRKSNKN